MQKLGQCPPKPRRERINPRYPRCLAALALAAATSLGCKEPEPEVEMAGQIAEPFEPATAPSASSAASTTTPTPPASSHHPATPTAGLPAAPFVPEKR